MQFGKIVSLAAVSATLAFTGVGSASAFGGHGGGGHGGGFGGGHGGGFGGGHVGGGGRFGGGGLGGGAARFGGGQGLAAGRAQNLGGGARFGGNRGVNVAGNRGDVRGNRGFRGGRGFGFGGFGLGYGGYDDFAYDGFGYDGADFADGGYGDAGYPNGYAYGPGVQYSQAPAESPEGLQTGRSVATLGDTCSTPVKACTLYNQSYVGHSCSCRVSGGRSHGHVTP